LTDPVEMKPKIYGKTII